MKEWKVQRKIDILKHNFIESWFELGFEIYDKNQHEKECLKSIILVAEITSHLNEDDFEIWQEVKKRLKKELKNIK